MHVSLTGGPCSIVFVLIILSVLASGYNMALTEMSACTFLSSLEFIV